MTTVCGSVVTRSSPRHPCGQWSRHLVRHDLCTILGEIPWRIRQVHRLCIDLALEKPPGVDLRPALVIRSTSGEDDPVGDQGRSDGVDGVGQPGRRFLCFVEPSQTSSHLGLIPSYSADMVPRQTSRSSGISPQFVNRRSLMNARTALPVRVSKATSRISVRLCHWPGYKGRSW